MSFKISANGLKLYFSGAFIYGLGILLTYYLPYYQSSLLPKTQTTLLILYLGYLLLGIIHFFPNSHNHRQNKPYLIITSVKRNLHNLLTQNTLSWTTEEKTAFLFLIIKLFFLPTMINFCYTNLNEVTNNINNITFNNSISNSINLNTTLWFPILLTLLFTLDTFIFTLGYCTESRKLNNICTSVEPTIFGWFVALICYPPFNSLIGQYIPWGAYDFAQFWTPNLTIAFRVIILLLLVIYVAASLALGTKASNLTNRGIVTKFPYSLIRHPAYTSKLLLWWLTLLPYITIPFALGMLFWSVIYLARAYTEEQHLLQDNNYKLYCQKTPYRFIPYII